MVSIRPLEGAGGVIWRESTQTSRSPDPRGLFGRSFFSLAACKISHLSRSSLPDRRVSVGRWIEKSENFRPPWRTRREGESVEIDLPGLQVLDVLM